MCIDVVPFLDRSGGGIYQYSLTILRALSEGEGNKSEHKFVVFVHDTHHPAITSLSGRGWTVKPSQPPSPKRLIKDIVRWVIGQERLGKAWGWFRRRLQGVVSLPDPDLIRPRPDMSRWVCRFGVELMLYPAPNPLSFETGIPYVMAIHDLQQRLQPEFPEVFANGEYERREYILRNGTRFATLLLADSEVGKEDILNFYGAYGVTSDRVKVLPFLPECCLSVDDSESERQRTRATYHLPERYLFYPAQFWPHKNHTRIVQALGLLNQEKRLKIPVVFCGSYAGEIRKRTFHDVMSLSRQLGLEDQVYYLGYVPDENMPGLYAGAAALVMPTFFGPTNIPVLEAWSLGCPVITSDIRGIRQQSGDTSLLVDPRSVEAIADGIYRLWTDESLRQTLASRGRQRLATYSPKHYQRRLAEILEEAKARVRSEKPLSARQ